MIDLNEVKLQGDRADSEHGGEQWDWDAMSATLRDCAYDWVGELFPRGRIVDGKLRLANIGGAPPHGDGSCVIELKGEKAGDWFDYSTGEGGQPCSTVKEATGLSGAELWRYCNDLLERHGGQLRSAPAKTAPPAEKTKRQENAETEIRHRLAHAVPYKATIAETYLLTRVGVAPDSSDLLFNNSVARNRREALSFPAMIARLRWPSGELSGGLHQTFLLDDGSHHVGDEKAKMMLGPELCSGAAVMLASHTGSLGVGEGIETTLAGMCYFGVPGWAMLSDKGLDRLGEYLRQSGGMIAAGPDQPAIKLQRLLIFADRGEGGEKNAWKLYRVARTLGIAVELYLPTGADDLCDDLANGRPAPEPQQEPGESQRKGALLITRDDDAPEIRIGGGRLPQNVDDAEYYLAARDPNVFQRGDFLVRPSKSVIDISHGRKIFAPRLKRIGVQHLTDRLTRVIDFQKYNAKKDQWISTDGPANIAAALLERSGMWKSLPYIRGIINAPTLRPDGSLLSKPGYDDQLCVLFDPGDTNFDAFEIPERPTKDQAVLCLNMLADLIREFPFVDRDGKNMTGKPCAGRSVALAHMLTGVIRRSLKHAPLFGFDATAPGTGKSLLVDTSAMISMGHECPVISQGGTEEETEKRLGASLLAGDTMISFDNCGKPLGGDILNQALTQTLLQIRILGTSDQPTLPSDALYSATGNNLTFIGDMGRRSLVARLDAEIEQPETREFETENPVVRVRRDRARYVAAALVILRAYEVVGRPDPSKPLGSFEDWSDRVRSALVWLDQPDPVETMERARESDPRRQRLQAVLHHWEHALGGSQVTTKQVIERATETTQGVNLNHVPFLYPDFREALLAVAGEGGAINSRRLGTWLRDVKGRRLGDKRIEEGTVSRGDNRWKLVVFGKMVDVKDVGGCVLPDAGENAE